MVRVAVIASAHGIRGELKLRPFLEDSSLIDNNEALVDSRGKSVRLKLKGCVGDCLIAQIQGVIDRNAAETLRGTELFLPRDSLPSPADNEFYCDTLVGLEVYDGMNNSLGKISAVHNFGAGDVVEIAFNDGRSEMFALNTATFPEISTDENRVILRQPDAI